jgi:hypothetical protein
MEEVRQSMRIPKRSIVTALSTLAIFSMIAAAFVAFHATGADAASGPSDISVQQVMSAAHAHHLGGVIVAGTSNDGGDHKPPAGGPAFVGDPPLLFNGAQGAASCQFPLSLAPCFNGNVMMTASTGPVVVVPIFWSPTGYPMSAAYKNLITTYLGDVAHDSGHTNNVFSVANEYHGNNGQIHYNVQLGPVLTDTNTIASDCTVAANDTTGIYPDGSGYSACVSDALLTAEVNSVTAANSLPHDLSHIYVMYFPKGVETCFNPGSTTSTAGGQACTINHQPTAAFCAYHSAALSNAVYANLSYPIYHSPLATTPFTCGSDARRAGFGQIESPNGNKDADVEISPTAHEINESITDPDVQTGWYDAVGFENGDECAYIYGQTRGAPGAYFNQVINGRNYLTQEMPSNNLFNSSGGTAACEQSS